MRTFCLEPYQQALHRVVVPGALFESQSLATSRYYRTPCQDSCRVRTLVTGRCVGQKAVISRVEPNSSRGRHVCTPGPSKKGHSPLSLLVGLSRGKVDTLFYLDRFLLRSVWEIAVEPSEYRAPHQDFGSCCEIGAKTHWGSIRSHFCVRPAPRPADAKATVAECTCTV